MATLKVPTEQVVYAPTRQRPAKFIFNISNINPDTYLIFTTKVLVGVFLLPTNIFSNP